MSAALQAVSPSFKNVTLMFEPWYFFKMQILCNAALTYDSSMSFSLTEIRMTSLQHLGG